MECLTDATEGAEARKESPVGVLDITVLMGGPSSERKVSLMSGSAIADGLGRRGHRVTRADILPNDPSALDRDGIDVVFIALHGEFGESGEVQRLCEDAGFATPARGPAPANWRSTRRPPSRSSGGSACPPRTG